MSSDNYSEGEFFSSEKDLQESIIGEIEMEEVAFLLAISAILYIIFWSLQNDKVRDQNEQTGLLRMKPHQPDKNLDV